MSTNSKRKDRGSLMNSVKKSLKSMRTTSSKTKTGKTKPKKSSSVNNTPPPSSSGNQTPFTMGGGDSNHYTFNEPESNSRKGSFMSFGSRSKGDKDPKSPSSHNKRSSISHSKSFNNLHPQFGIENNNTNHNHNTNTSRRGGGGHRKNDSYSIGLGIDCGNTKVSTLKLKSSGKLYKDFNVPQLYINKKPEKFKNVRFDENEFNHMLYDENGNINKVIIPINIDIEQVYNEEYDNNYNRKVLGPLEPVRFPIIIECHPDEDILAPEENQYAHIEDIDEFDSDYICSSDDDLDDLTMDLSTAKPLTIVSTQSMQNWNTKDIHKTHKKSASMVGAPHQENKSNVATMSRRTIGDINDTATVNEGGVKKKNINKNGGKQAIKASNIRITKPKPEESPPPAPHVNLKRKEMIRNSQRNKAKNMVNDENINNNNNNNKEKVEKVQRGKRKTGKRKRVKVHKKSGISTTINGGGINKDESKASIKFENKYDGMSNITPDELEILARKLLNAKTLLNEDNNCIGFDGKHGRRNSFNYKHPKSKIKRNQHNHLLQSNVNRKSESVSFGLQLINSIKSITSNICGLMEQFSDGLNDLLRICQQFIELIIDPLPRQVYNDYNDKIGEYEQLVGIIDSMSNNFYDSACNLRDNLPSLSTILQSNINDRINEYNLYINSFKSADNDIKSLQIHCDRVIRRLFRELPNNKTNSNELKQHKGIRVFGDHYVAANSNEAICRSVPSKMRSGIMNNYIHYLTLVDTMNWNTKNCYDVVLPSINVEFEESQFEIKQHVTDSLKCIDKNLSIIHNKDSHNNNKGKKQFNNNYHRYNANKPHFSYDRDGNIMNKQNNNHRHQHRGLHIIAPYDIHENVLMASPMHVNDVILKIMDYVNEKHENKTFDEFEIVQIKKKNYRDQKKQENGKFSLKNYGIKFDSTNFVENEVILNFFNNHYYHLGDILFEIPDLYEAFENYLIMKLSSENLYFLREIDDIYFNLDQLIFNHNVAIQETNNIYSKFIDESSSQQINLPGNITKKINKDLKKINKFKDPLSIFDKAYDCISSLIHKESLPNFYKSQHFKNWYEKQREINEKIFKKERKMMKK